MASHERAAATLDCWAKVMVSRRWWYSTSSVIAAGMARTGTLSVTGNEQEWALSMLGHRMEGRYSPGTSSGIAAGNGWEQAHLSPCLSLLLETGENGHDASDWKQAGNERAINAGTQDGR